MKDKIALPHKFDADMVLTPDRGSMSKVKARKLGYKISSDSDSESNANTFETWRTRVSCLPEARERPAALAELIASQPFMTIETSRAYLRGLPVESKEEKTSVPPDNTNDPRAARLAEISRNMQAINKERGYASKPQAMAQPQAPRDIEPAKLRRLAEIRLAAIDAGGKGGVEARNLRYALSVLDATGAPPATVFHQLNIDTSKFISS